MDRVSSALYIQKKKNDGSRRIGVPSLSVPACRDIPSPLHLERNFSTVNKVLIVHCSACAISNGRGSSLAVIINLLLVAKNKNVDFTASATLTYSLQLLTYSLQLLSYSLQLVYS